MEQWVYALKVAFLGLSGVFAGLMLLMWAVKLTSFVLKTFTKKS
jgi:Na+-transporting methylmalonyl-CoA/oxaloacetate decarboxylase gamma subunit